MTLKFAELYWSTAGSRVFNVFINGNQVLTNFDIVAQAGAKNTAIDKPFPVTVTNGQITLQFTGVLDYPWINAISIAQSGASQSPALQSVVVSPTSVVGGTNVNVTVALTA